jgi:hypothetical protein
VPRDEASPPPEPTVNPITTWNEKSLHADLKAWCAQPGDRQEVPLAGCCIDVVRGDGPDAVLFEVQTAGLGAIRGKLTRLLNTYRVCLIMPVPAQKWIVRREEGAPDRRRKSPKRGTVLDVFSELVRGPALLAHPRFSLTVALTWEEEVRGRVPGVRAWRRKGWAVLERRLLKVAEAREFDTPEALAALLPGGLPKRFDTAELAQAWNVPRWLAQKAAYCYRELGVVQADGKRGNAVVYTLVNRAGAAPASSSTSRTT